MVRPSWFSWLLLLSIAQPAAAQVQDPDLSRFRVRQVNGQRLDGWDGLLAGDTLRGRLSTGENVLIPIAEIEQLEVISGSRWLRGALAGSALGALIVLGAWAQVEADPTHEVREDRLPIVAAAAIGGGALVGGIIGSRQKRWSAVVLPSASGPASPRPSLRLGVALFF